MKKAEELLILLNINEESFVDDALFGMETLFNNHPLRLENPQLFEEFASRYKTRFEKELHDRWESMRSLILKSCWEHYTDEHIDALIQLYKKHPELPQHQKNMHRELHTIIVTEYTKIGDKIGEAVAKEIDSLD